MIDDANKRFYRRCDEFAICVNIGKAGYVTAESRLEIQYFNILYMVEVKQVLCLLKIT